MTGEVKGICSLRSGITADLLLVSVLIRTPIKLVLGGVGSSLQGFFVSLLSDFKLLTPPAFLMA